MSLTLAEPFPLIWIYITMFYVSSQISENSDNVLRQLCSKDTWFVGRTKFLNKSLIMKIYIIVDV